MESPVALVGRGESCDLILTHESVSRLHASLLRTSKGVWIVDLLAREGVFVNGVKVKWAWLDDGDTVKIGQFTFRLRYKTPPETMRRHDVPLEAGASPPSTRTKHKARALASSREGRTDLAVRARTSSTVSVPTVASSRSTRPALLALPSSAYRQPDTPTSHHQLALWQQQMRMMESFHDDMMFMVQMFVAMHREHLGAVKNELDKVRLLTQELCDLQETLEEPSEFAEDGRSADNNATSANGSANRSYGNGSMRAGVAQAPSQTQACLNEAATSPGSASRAVTFSSIAPAAESAVRTVPPRSSPMDQAKFHTDLTKRISELQRERQGYWQRILGAINKQSI
jgi:hypothetical protein